MEVLLLIRELAWGGAERQMVELACGLARRGVDVAVAVFYRHDGAPLELQLARAGVRLIGLDKRGATDVLGFSRRLLGLFREERPGVIYSFLPLGNLAALLAHLGERRPAIAWGVRCSAFEGDGVTRRERALGVLEARLSRLPDLIVANSHRAAADARARGFPCVEVIANGIDVDRFRPRPDEGRAARASWGMAADAELVGTVGKLDPMKDFVTFTRAATLLRRRRPVHFMWVGPATPASREALARARRAHGDPPIEWRPPRTDIESVYSAFDIGTLCSAYGEGFPNVVGEAMACGAPCAVTDVGDAGLVVGDTGVVVPPRDPERLARAWEALLDRVATRRTEARQAARARIVEHFSVEVMVDRTLRRLSALAPSVVGRAGGEPALQRRDEGG